MIKIYNVQQNARVVRRWLRSLLDIRYHNLTIIIICLFCNKPGMSKPLRNASTRDLDTKVKQCAINLKDQHLLAKLSRGVFVAIEMKYHPQCLVALYNRDQSSKSQKSTPPDTASNTTFVELLSYQFLIVMRQLAELTLICSPINAHHLMVLLRVIACRDQCLHHYLLLLP